MEKGESLFWRRTREEVGAKGNSSNRGLSEYFFSRGRVKGEKTSVKGFESRGERMHRDVHVQLFRIDRDISFSSYLLQTVFYCQVYVPNIYSFLSLSCEFNHLSHIPNCISLYFFTLFYLLFYKISFVLQFASHNYFAICQITYTLISLLSSNIQIKIISYKFFYIASSFHFIEFNFQDKYLHRITNN